MMSNRRVWRLFPWRRAAGLFLLLLTAGLVIFVTIANAAYYRPLPADLPCRGCSGEALSVHVGGFDLYYRELGRGGDRAPVVLLHGGPGHSSLSFKQSFDFLADQYRVVYYDQRGSGSSQILPDSRAYTLDQLVEELEALRREVIRAERIVVVGHSFGGALAQRYALKYAGHVERLVLVSSVRINNGVSLPALFDRLLPALFVLGGWPPIEAQARDSWFAQLNEAGAAARLYDPANTGLLKDAGYLSFATWREVSRSAGGDDFSDELHELDIPTLVIYGAADSEYTGEATASSLCGLLLDCTLRRFERSGHWPFLEEPDQFAQVLSDFLTEK